MNPTISIIMGIYNCEETMDASIQSIISQSYQDWEMILCDDGSSDNSYIIAKKYAEEYPNKIRVIKNEKNLGLNETLNRCLLEVRGEYIARMDGDDISLPERLEKQMNFLKSNQEFQMVGTLAQYFDESGKWGVCHLEEIPSYSAFLKNSPFIHPSMLMKKSMLDDINGYSVSKKLLRVEDYHLWVKLYDKGYRGYNIQEVLYLFRDDRNAYNRRKYRFRINEFRVRWLIARKFPLGMKAYICAFRPLIVGALPRCVYDILHKRNIKSSGK